MSSKLSFILILLSLINNIFSISENSFIENDSKYQNYEYLNIFKIPNSLIISSKKEDNKKTLLNKFISFLSMSSTSSTITSKINFSFKDKTNFNRIVIQKSLDKQCNQSEIKIRIYYRKLSQDIFNLFENYSIKQKGENIIIFLNEKIECNDLKLEIDELEDCPNKIKEEDILFLSPETEYINENIINVFDKNDYRKLTLSKEYNTKEFVTNLENDSKNYELSDYAKNYIKRIKAVYLGDISYDPRREFTTNGNAYLTRISQDGDIEKYSKETLKMHFGATNRRSTGIFGRANEVFTIHVKKGNDKDPLPSLRFGQHIGYWRNWLGKIITLKEGTQQVTVDNFQVDGEGYTVPTIPGGPLYIINPYTSSEQSKNLTVYIEGGIIFPIFIQFYITIMEYQQQLTEYVKLVKKDNLTYPDITESVGYKIMLTMRATDAYKIYYTDSNSISPIKNVQNWDSYLVKLMTFDGMAFYRDQPYFDIRNAHLLFNIRFMQPYAYAYAHYEHIGIQNNGVVEILLNLNEKEVGWGLPHEFGHMIDISERIVGETSNNMISKYSDTYIQGDGSWGPDRQENKIKYLTPDNIDNLLRGCDSTDTSQCKGFLTNKPLNYLVFWDLESLYHGYWGKVDNMYRYNNTLSSKLTKEEKFVYFSNIVLGLDLGYYFTRWGLSFSDGKSMFNELKTSSEYKDLMQKAINNKLIDTKTKKKYWYFDYKEYTYINDVGLGCYKDKNEYNIQITKITHPQTNKYTLTLPKVNCQGHLGFEIYESNTIIGFTYDYTYTDTTTYKSGYTPKYKIIAYDRLLDTSNESAYKSFTSNAALKQLNSINVLE